MPVECSSVFRQLNKAKECYDNVRESEAKGRLVKKLKELEEDETNSN